MLNIDKREATILNWYCFERADKHQSADFVLFSIFFCEYVVEIKDRIGCIDAWMSQKEVADIGVMIMNSPKDV